MSASPNPGVRGGVGAAARGLSPPGTSIALSMGWAFRRSGRDLPALSLAVGVAVARALGRAGAGGVMLKWPNDIWYRDRKIGGILLESRAEAEGPAFVVIGIGINVTLSEEERGALAQGACGLPLADACQKAAIAKSGRGAMLDELFGMLVQFERDGIAPFLAAWAGLDALRDRSSRVWLGSRWMSAVRPRPWTARGHCCFEVDGRFCINSGEVSLRLEGESGLRNLKAIVFVLVLANIRILPVHAFAPAPPAPPPAAAVTGPLTLASAPRAAREPAALRQSQTVRGGRLQPRGERPCAAASSPLRASERRQARPWRKTFVYVPIPPTPAAAAMLRKAAG